MRKRGGSKNILLLEPIFKFLKDNPPIPGGVGGTHQKPGRCNRQGHCDNSPPPGLPDHSPKTLISSQWNTGSPTEEALSLLHVTSAASERPGTGFADSELEDHSHPLTGKLVAHKGRKARLEDLGGHTPGERESFGGRSRKILPLGGFIEGLVCSDRARHPLWSNAQQIASQ